LIAEGATVKVSQFKMPPKSIYNKNCGLYYKPIMIVNDDSRVVNKLEASITDNDRVVIYDHHMFIVQATGVLMNKKN